MYPELQVQLNDPSVSVQSALGSQSSASVVHSLMSKEDDTIILLVMKAFQIFTSNSVIE